MQPVYSVLQRVNAARERIDVDSRLHPARRRRNGKKRATEEAYWYDGKLASTIIVAINSRFLKLAPQGEP